MSYAFFYKSINGDRVYDDTSFEHWLKKFFTSGVFLNDLQVTANDDMTVTVGAGYANIDGKVKIFESTSSLIIETAGASYPRIDSIVLERNDTERDILLKVVKGGYSSEPVPHTPVRQDGVYQLVIAQVLVNAGAVKVTQANITDTRSNTELCGIVAGAVKQIDFSQVQAQFDAYFAQYKKQIATDYAQYNYSMEEYLDQMEADFSAWFEEIRNQLDEDAAGHLQNQIDDINARLEYAGGSIVEITVDAGEFNAEGLEVNLEIGGKTYAETINDNIAKFTGVLEVGTAKITCVDESQEINVETSINIPYYGAYETSITLKSGGSYKEWIEAGGLSVDSYESLESLLEDEKAVRTLMTKKESVDVLARMSGEDLATIINNPYVAKWVNYREYAYSTLSAVPEIKNLMDEAGMYGMYITTYIDNPLIPIMTSNTTPSGVASGTNIYNSNYSYYNAFNDTVSSVPFVIGASDCRLSYEFTTETLVKSFFIMHSNTATNNSVNLYGDNEFIVSLELLTASSGDDYKTEKFKIPTNKKYKKYEFIFAKNPTTGSTSATFGNIRRLQLYGEATPWQPKGLVPVMKSNTAPYGEVIYDSEYSSYYAYKCFDNDLTTFWGSDKTETTNVGAYVGYKFTNPTLVKQISVQLQTTKVAYPMTVKIQASNDNVTWVDVSGFTIEGNAVERIINTDNYYLYYRLYIVDQTRENTYSGLIASLQFYGRQIEALIPPMTSNTTHEGEITAKEYYSADYEPYKAFDGNSNGVGWVMASEGEPCWIMYKFTKPTIVTGCYYQNRTRTTLTFELQGSNNGSSFDSLCTISAVGDVNAEVIKTFDNKNAYLYYRFYTESGSKTGGGNKFQLYGAPDYESRTYIYDHGVEVCCESINVANGWKLCNGNMDAQLNFIEPSYDNDCVKLAPAASQYSGIASASAFNLSNYDLIFAEIEGGVSTSSVHGGLSIYPSKNSNTNTQTTAQYNIPSPHNQKVCFDVSGVSSSEYVTIWANNTRTLTVYTLWIE